MISLTAKPTGLVPTVVGQLAELSPITSYLVLGYLLARLLIPVVLIVFAGRIATPTQRMSLVRDYLLHGPPPRRAGVGSAATSGTSARQPCSRPAHPNPADPAPDARSAPATTGPHPHATWARPSNETAPSPPDGSAQVKDQAEWFAEDRWHVIERFEALDLGRPSTFACNSRAPAAVVAGELLDRAATGMRNRLRMRQDPPLQLILPDWARGILRSDLALQEPGDGTLGVTDAELAQYLATRNVAVTWAMDGEAGQNFNVQAAGPVNAWPTSVICYLFPAGAFQLLDGGTLDLGLVRDSTLNAANDFQVFSETFEDVLFRGGLAYRLTQALTPSGIARAAEAAGT